MSRQPQQHEQKSDHDRSIFGYPKHHFLQLSDADENCRRERFIELLENKFANASRHLETLRRLSDNANLANSYFAEKFSRIGYSSKLLEAVLDSTHGKELFDNAFDNYLDKVLAVFLVRITGNMASFESLGLLDHYITLQKLSEAEIPGLNIEAMLAFGEMAPIRSLCQANNNESFWLAAKSSLTQIIDSANAAETIAFIKQSLQMPHRPFRPHDHKKMGPAIVEAFQPAKTAAEKVTIYEDILKNWRSPEDIVNWAGKNYSYDFDRGSIMSAGNSLTVYEPREFFERGCGVCIDFSNFIVSTLRKINPELRPYLFRMEYKIPNDFRGSPFYSHWSAAYQQQDKWFVLGDSKLGGMISGPYNALDDYREDYSRYRGLEYHKHDLYEDLSVFYDLLR